MHVRRRQLKLDIMLIQEGSECLGTFIVQALYAWLEAVINQLLDEFVVGPYHLFISPVIHWLCEYVIGIIIIED
jgi:hypothetical protein